MYGLNISLSQSEIRNHAALVKSEMITEFLTFPLGSSIESQIFQQMYSIQGYSIGVSKPGKEFFSENIKYQSGVKSNNPNDMAPRLYKGNVLVQYDGSFEAIFKEFVRIHDSVESLQILGALLYRNAFLLDHVKENGKWRYKPSSQAIEKIKEKCKTFLSLPVEVFLHYLELIASNEDTKYNTLGYDINKGFGRRNNLLTYANVINVILQKHYMTEEDFLLAFMSFAGRLTSPPSGLNPITNKKAKESFPQLTSEI
jgi:hypothetical protein